MREVKADTKPIERLIEELRKNGGKVAEGLQVMKDTNKNLPASTFEFVRKTFDVCNHKAVHQVASYFLYGREDPIPEMFQSLLGTLESTGVSCEGLIIYLKRHIEVDSEDHGPLVAKLMKLLCNTDKKKWDEAIQSGIQAIEARILLWDGIYHEIKKL